jgi:polyphosphate kinase 2 (PPK2 family)
MSNTHRLDPGRPIRIDQLPTRADGFHDNRERAESEFRELRKEIAELQHRFYSEGRRRFLIVFQAMDAGGKDGTIRRVFQGVNPQGVRVTSFKAPSKRELAHDYLWRIHRQVPGRGMIGLFNRSHYEDVLIVRVDRQHFQGRAERAVRGSARGSAQELEVLPRGPRKEKAVGRLHGSL